jgi:hypothetical protein
MQALHPTLAVVVVYGKGATLYVPPAHRSHKHRHRIDLLRSECDLEVGELLTLMEKRDVVIKKKPNAKQKSSAETLCTLPCLSGYPFAVIGYSMMIRGDSFRSDYRVPTHMVNHLSNAMSIDRLVQSAGRATFQGAKYLADNGFECVHVLMLQTDFATVQAYVKFMDELRDRLVIQKLSVEQCFDSERFQYPAALAILASEHQKRCIGNRREMLYLDPSLFEGHEERVAAEAAAKAAKEEKKAADAAATKAANEAANAERARQKLLSKQRSPGDAKRKSATPSSGDVKRTRVMEDPVAWAAARAAELRAGAIASVPVKCSKSKQTILSLGVLHPASLVRLSSGLLPELRLVPVGLRATCVVDGAEYEQAVSLDAGRLAYAVCASGAAPLQWHATPKAAWQAALGAAAPKRDGWAELGLRSNYGRALVDTLLTPELRRGALAAYTTVEEERAGGGGAGDPWEDAIELE